MVTYHFIDKLSPLLLRTYYDFKQYSFHDTHLLTQGPHLKYCILLWSPQQKKVMKLLEVIQRRATEKIKVIEQLRELGLFRGKNRRLLKDRIVAFQYFKG